MPEKEFNWGSVCIFVFYLFPGGWGGGGGGLAKKQQKCFCIRKASFCLNILN